jgi:crotonobetainyl-CoA:carnitine CoA-transferase CaiB-like acyl-CoA transferase
MGWIDPRDGESFMWKLLGRGKRAAVLDLKTAAGLAAMLRLLDSADVLIENLRPGTLERLGLDPVDLLERNPGLVILRVTGFGQDGPYAGRPGFATMAEAMSGFAAINGEPDGAPLLPPIALTDEVTALAGAFTVMTAIHHRDRSGEGQVIDLNLLETMLQLMGALSSANAHLGYLQPRLGSGIPYTVPRGTYRCSDGQWVAISTSAESIATRVMELLDVADDPRFATFDGRVDHRVELDAIVAAWVGARTMPEVLAAFEARQAAIAPVYTMADLLADPHVAAREAVITVDGVRMPGVLARFSKTPGTVRHAGRALGVDTDAVLADLWEPRPESEIEAGAPRETSREVSE